MTKKKRLLLLAGVVVGAMLIAFSLTVTAGPWIGGPVGAVLAGGCASVLIEDQPRSRRK